MLGIFLPPRKNQGIASSPVPPNSSLSLLSGGSFGGEVFVDSSSAFNVFGTAFFLDGVELTDLVAGQAFTIDLNGSSVGNFLSGNLADGSAFNFFIGGFESGALVTITLVPAPATGAILAAAGLLTIRRRRR